MVEDAKRFFVTPPPLFSDLFVEETVAKTIDPQPAIGSDHSGALDDPLPPWGSCGRECPVCRSR